MHLTITDPITGETLGTLCIDRGAGTCYILEADIEVLNALVATAIAAHAPEVRLVVPIDAVAELEAIGWKRAKDLAVLRKEG